jgi:predicted metalloprotease with PDZ domain
VRTFFLWALAGSVPLFAQNTVELHVDATAAAQRVIHVRMTMPAQPGPLTLLYPEWIPGEHGPTGPIVNLVGLKFSSEGRTIPWKRDSVNMYAFHLEIPAGAKALDAAFDFLSPPDSSGFTSGASTTSELAVLSWNQLLLYPEGAAADSLQYHASLQLPPSWKYGTALPIQRESGGDIEFRPASLTTLVDSPLSAGAHYRTVDLGTGTIDPKVPHYLHLAGDSDRAVDIPAEVVVEYKNLVAETGALYGTRHYRDYHFLLTLSDHVAHFGLEHHESSDDRVDERTLIDGDPRRLNAFLLPHEFTHSWNGKFRRPAGLVKGTSDGGYDTPMKGDLLWVYEGLTEYLGEVLSPRSGLWTPEEYRDWIAITAASLDRQSGRTWRPLEDTAVAAQVLYTAGDDYSEYRRSVDYYPEGTLIWMDADVKIRQLSQGRKSLDDFCRAFLGGPGGVPEMKPYTFEDVVAAMNAVEPFDWAGFFNQRLHSTGPHAPLGGIEGGGWKLAYDGVRSDFWKSYEDDGKMADLSYSLGLKVKDDGTVIDVAYGGPAQKAGVAPAVKVIAVNRRQFSLTILREAVAAAAPVDLLIKTGEYYETRHVDYRDGERYPHLVRDSSKPDLLSDIIRPRTR